MLKIIKISLRDDKVCFEMKNNKMNGADYLIISGVLSVLAGFVMLGYEILLWLQNGSWPKMNLIWLFLKIIPENDNARLWLYYPDSWVGLHYLLEHIDTSFFFNYRGCNCYAGYTSF